MIHLKLGSKIKCTSWVCNHIIGQMHLICYENRLRVTNLGPPRMDTYNFGNYSSNQINGYWNCILCRQISSLTTLYLNGFKAFYSNKPTDTVKTKLGNNNESDNTKPKKPKKELKTYITLLGVDNSISVSTVEAAKKLAERRNFHLVKVLDFDPKSSRAVYKLVTESQYLKEDWDDSKSKKDKSNIDDKLVSLSSNTNENDVLTRVKMIKKWLTKKLEVRVVITGDITAGENVYKLVEKGVGSDGRIVQKRAKSSNIRFQILPPKKSEEKAVEK